MLAREGCTEAEQAHHEGVAVTVEEKAEDRRIRAINSHDRRDALRAAKLCINGPSHGPLAPGKTKCQRCIDVHRASAL
jgi:hypothetical protein